MTKSRNALLDWLRVLAIIMIATVHTWSLAHVDAELHPVLFSIYNGFYRWGVPLFVMLSGALQLSASPMPIGEFYKKRYKRILIPFFIWSTVVYIISCIIGKYANIHSFSDAMIYYLPYLLTNRINEAYWFIGLIIVLYAITPFIQKALLECSRKQLILICIIWFLYIIIRHYFPAFELLKYSSKLTIFLGYYILGYLLYREWGQKIIVKQSTLIRTVSDISFMTYLTHMVFITPFYMLVGFSGTTAPLWLLILMPISTSVLVVAICTFGGILLKKMLPFYRYLGIN